MTTPEGKNTKYLKHVCKALNVSLFKQSFEGTVGAPDWLLCHGGRSMMIELKSPTGKLRVPQERMIGLLITKGGFPVWVCSSPADINRAIEESLFGGVNVTGAL